MSIFYRKIESYKHIIVHSINYPSRVMYCQFGWRTFCQYFLIHVSHSTVVTVMTGFKRDKALNGGRL